MGAGVSPRQLSYLASFGECVCAFVEMWGGRMTGLAKQKGEV